MNKEKKTAVRVEQRHIDEARHSEADNGRRVGTDPISLAVLEVVKEKGIEHDRAWTYRGRKNQLGVPTPGLWLCVRPNEDVKLPSECDNFMYEFDRREDGKPQPFMFEVEL